MAIRLYGRKPTSQARPGQLAKKQKRDFIGLGREIPRATVVDGVGLVKTFCGQLFVSQAVAPYSASHKFNAS